MNGFTYNGIHCESLNVYYIPDATARGDFQSEYEVLDGERAWFSGGYFFKSRVRVRQFDIPCFYEEVTSETREKIIRWLDRKTSGILTFDERPYAEYFVRPAQKIGFSDYKQGDRFSGTFTITFAAYEPFAQMKYSTCEECDNSRAYEETGILPASYTASLTSNTGTERLIYNIGTEIGHSIIRVEGNIGNSDLVITNSTNGTKCALKSGTTIPSGYAIEINSRTGRVELVSNSNRELAFEYHDLGYIVFDSCMPFYKDVSITTTAGSRNIVSEDGIFHNGMVGQYVYLNNEWRYIGAVSSATEATLNAAVSTSGTVDTHIVKMNLLTIDKASDSTATIDIQCLPQIR